MTTTMTPPMYASVPAPPLTPAASLEATGLKLTCKQPDLARGLSIVNRAVLAHSTKPILSNILVATDQGRLRLSATTLELGIQVWLDAQIEGEGVTAIPADLLTKMVALLPNAPMTCSVVEGSQTLRLHCAKSVSHLRGQDPREFPLIPTVEAGKPGISCQIEAGLLKQMIHEVAFAASDDESKPVLTAVCTQIGAGKLTLAAANTLQVAERTAPLPHTSESVSRVLIPARTMMELERILPNQGVVQVMVTEQENQVIFHCEEGERIDVVSRLIAGIYPPYERAIPATFTTRAVADTKPFAAAVAQAALFARDLLKTARVTVRPGAGGGTMGTLIIEADDADRGGHTAVVDATVTGPERCLIVPITYLANTLARIQTPQVAFSMLESGQPTVFRPVGEVPYTCMVMSARQEKR